MELRWSEAAEHTHVGEEKLVYFAGWHWDKNFHVREESLPNIKPLLGTNLDGVSFNIWLYFVYLETQKACAVDWLTKHANMSSHGCFCPETCGAQLQLKHAFEGFEIVITVVVLFLRN